MKKKKLLIGSTIFLTSTILLAGCFGEKEPVVKMQKAEVYLEDGTVQTVEAEDINMVLYYFIEEGNNITLTGYRGVNTNLVIPEKINGKPVTKIQSAVINDDDTIVKASFNNLNLTSVVFPKTLKEIGAYAFYKNSLISVTIPGNVELVGESVFANNFIESVVLEDGVKEIGKNAFANNYINKLTLSQTLEKIGANSFTNNKITRLEINPALKIINDSAFTKNQIEELIIPENASLEVISNEAFKSNLIREIKFNKNIKDIGSNAFTNNRINKLEIPSTIENIYNGAFKENQMPVDSIDLNDYNGNVTKSSFDDGVVKDDK